jgi:E3 ubiquitin-protein ligase RNF14
MRLWELEEGDGDEADRRAVREAREMEFEEEEEEEIPEVAEAIIQEPEVEEPTEPEPVVPQQALQREGPLIFRINQLPPQPVPPPVPNPPPADQRNRGPQRQGPQDVRRQAPGHPIRGRRGQAARNPGRGDAAAQQEAAHQAWVQMFVQMALNDEEDQLDWNSEDEEDAAAWEIPVR